MQRRGVHIRYCQQMSIVINTSKPVTVLSINMLLYLWYFTLAQETRKISYNKDSTRYLYLMYLMYSSF